MTLPLNLQGDPVDFYNQMKAKKKQSPRKTDTDSDCTPEKHLERKSSEKHLERKSSAKGHNQRKKSSSSNTETSNVDKSPAHVNSPDNHSPEHKVPKHEESGVSLTDRCDSSITDVSQNADSVITGNADAVLSQDSKADAGAQLNNAETVCLNNMISGDCSYHATDNLNSKLSTGVTTTSGLAR